MLDELSQVLESVGKSTTKFVAPDGSRLLLLSYGARMLGLADAASTGNFFWTNPLLGESQIARSFFSGNGWHNTGGDRTWIAPEQDTFFAEADASQYHQPRQLDMSDYAVDRICDGVQLSRTMTLHLARPNRDVALRIAKWFGPAPNPLRYEREMTATAGSVAYAGYTQRVTLQSLGEDPPPRIGIWNLVQFPPGGQMLVPLYSTVTPQKCFGDVPAGHVTIEDRLLRIKIDFSGSHKIAVKAVALCGRAAYSYGNDEDCVLIVRNFSVNPSGEYIDAQRHDPNDFGYGFQMCRVDEIEYGSFCELEYHAPALGMPPEPHRSEDVSQLWAFRGPREAVDTIAQKLVGARL